MSPSLFGELLSIIGRYWRRYLLALLVLITSNLLMVASPLIFRHAVTRLDKEAPLDTSLVSQWLSHLQAPLFDSVWTWGLILLLIASIAAYFVYAMRVRFISLSRDAEQDLRARLFARIQAQAQPFYDRHRVGDLMSRFTNDISVFRDVAGPGMLYPTYFVTLVIPLLIALFTISAPLALIAIIPIVVLPPLTLLARKLLYKTSIEVQRSIGELSTLAQEDYAGIRLIKAYAREGTFARRFRLLSMRFFRLSMRLFTVTNLFFPFLSVLGRLVTVAIIVVAGFLIAQITSADLVSFMWLQSYVLLPVLMLGWILPLYQRGRGAYSRLYTLYREPLDLLDEGKALPISPAPSLSLKGLTFAFEGGVNVLDSVTTELPGGSIIGITGPPGSGKSTLISLLMRDYPVLRGMIEVAGREIADYSLQSLRRSMALVEQDPFLFSRTLGENIALARPDAPLETVIAQAGLAGTVAQLPRGLDTMVGERGVTLSGGQKQRVAIARALLIDAPILLLDDSFSSLDNITADGIMTTLESLRGQKTVLIVSHQVHILGRCDHLLCLTHGRLHEQGSPKDLAKGDGHYAALVELDRLVHGRAS